MKNQSPLQEIHKKGIYGDYDNKNEQDILKVKEVSKDLKTVSSKDIPSAVIIASALPRTKSTLSLKEIRVWRFAS